MAPAAPARILFFSHFPFIFLALARSPSSSAAPCCACSSRQSWTNAILMQMPSWDDFGRCADSRRAEIKRLLPLTSDFSLLAFRFSLFAPRLPLPTRLECVSAAAPKRGRRASAPALINAEGRARANHSRQPLDDFIRGADLDKTSLSLRELSRELERDTLLLRLGGGGRVNV